MPRTKSENILSDDGKTQVVEFEASEGKDKGTQTTRYARPTLASFQEYIMSLSDKPADGSGFLNSVFPLREADEDDEDTDGDESPLAFAHRMYTTALANRARSMVYKSIAAQSTFVMIGGEKRDLMELPVKVVVRGYNSMNDQVVLRSAVADKAAFEAEGTDKDTPELAQRRANAIAGASKSIGFGPWSVAARKLVEEKKATRNADGVLAVAA